MESPGTTHGRYRGDLRVPIDVGTYNTINKGAKTNIKNDVYTLKDFLRNLLKRNKTFNVFFLSITNKKTVKEGSRRNLELTDSESMQKLNVFKLIHYVLSFFFFFPSLLFLSLSLFLLVNLS